jgi:hypothetical protein
VILISWRSGYVSMETHLMCRTSGLSILPTRMTKIGSCDDYIDSRIIKDVALELTVAH